MRLHLIAFVLIALSTFAISNPVHAADAVVGDGSTTSCNEAAFDAALATAHNGGGTITFNCGGAATIPFTSQKILDSEGATFVIDGGGNIALDGGNVTRLFRVANGRNQSLTLRGITLTNGRAAGYPDEGDDASQGGAILFGFGNNTLRIENSRFINNTAVTNGGTWDGGGAIHIRIGQLFISDSLFEGNTAPNGGAMNILITSGTIENTVFRRNSATTTIGGGGGAIYIDNGMLTFDRILVENNTSTRFGAGYFNCGGSRNIGHETITNSTFRNNTITGDGTGAGVYNCDDGITITDTTINNNTGPTHAGGFWHHSNSNPASTATVINTTISGNVATSGNGAGVTSNGPAPMTIYNSLIYNNLTGVQGSAIRTGEGSVTLINTIIANNSSAHEWVNTQCHGTILDGGGNLQFPATNEDGRDATCLPNIRVSDPRLGQLADNGGNTQTHALLAGSPAIDAAPTCPVNTDQRGIARPQGAACDIGPFELEGDGTTFTGIPGDLSVTNLASVPVVPTFTWTHQFSENDTTVPGEWFHIYLRPQNGRPVELWFEAVNVCEGLTCTATIADAYPLKGVVPAPYGLYSDNYDWWVGAYWQSGGSWSSIYGQGESFSIIHPAPSEINRIGPDGETSIDDSFRWETNPTATWYWLYARNADGFVLSQWFDGADICNEGVCSVALSDSIPGNGAYEWYINAWGPGGMGRWTLTPMPFTVN